MLHPDPVSAAGRGVGPVRVWKFGTRSVAEPSRIPAIAERMVVGQRVGAQPVAVLSAMGSSTRVREDETVFATSGVEVRAALAPPRGDIAPNNDLGCAVRQLPAAFGLHRERGVQDERHSDVVRSAS